MLGFFFVSGIIQAMMKFPYGFFWGASLSAHQAEGGNINSDWWKWEQESAQRVKSGPACMHYERYKEDFDLAKSIGHNCARLSVEWCRIEPSRGKFDTEAISHYKDVVAALRQRNIEPVVTLHHFTSPQWFADMGGWSDKRAVRSFLAYAEQIVSELAPYVTYWVTINEPLIYIFYGYILGAWPPNRRSLALALAVRKNMILSHIACHRLIHSLYRQKKLPAPSVSIAHHMPAYVACTNSLRDKFSVSLRKALVDFNILDVLARNKSLDYIGVNYYRIMILWKRIPWAGRSIRRVFMMCSRRLSGINCRSLYSKTGFAPTMMLSVGNL
ncbi:MAG: family 1 glycosylhydrolase [Candidatus Omnitrophica bacterium]|nr:family 1 glycosylhydrolase [Candidatus Omnitrophota bacterium]